MVKKETQKTQKKYERKHATLCNTKKHKALLGEVGNKSKSFFEKFIFFKKYKISCFTHLWLL